MRVAFIVPVLAHARYRKRIVALSRLGAETNVLAFSRDYYSTEFRDQPVTSLGYIEHGNYGRRILPLLRAVPRVRAAARAADVLYAFELDSMLLAWLSVRGMRSRPKLFYEVGDIREIMTGGSLLSRLFRALERFLLKDVHTLVVTSIGFLTGYYEGTLGEKSLTSLVIENKVDLEAQLPVPAAAIAADDGVLRIGYFGLIRCRDSWEVLKAVANAGEGKISISVRGKFMNLEDAKNEVGHIPNLDYGGPYVSPDDLSEIYSSVDLVWVAQHHTDNNTRWARVNRFYEACFFQKPMFAQIGTLDGNAVAEYGLGVCLDVTDKESSVDAILRTTKVDVESWRQNLDRLAGDVYCLTDEHVKLIEAMQ